MRYLIWAALVASAMTIISVYAEAYEDAARVAPKVISRLPASTMEPVPVDDEATAILPGDLDQASVEVGFSQDNEPEPHLLAVGSADRVHLFKLDEQSEAADAKPAQAATEPPAGLSFKLMPTKAFEKRFHQVVKDERFFDARQARPKGRCHDRYVLRVKFGDRFKERRGCTNQSDDPFAAFAQLFFRDAFLVWSRAERAQAAAQAKN